MREFLRSPDTIQNLKRAGICLQATRAIVNITARKPKKGAEPTLVTLSRGVVQQVARDKVKELLPLLSTDPELDVAETTVGLLVTLGHALARFAQYLEYPAQIWMLSRRYNPHGYPASM